MTIPGLINELIERDIRIEAHGEELKIKGSKDRMSVDLIEKIRANKEGLLKYLKEQQSGAHLIAAIPVINESIDYPVSASQLRLWLLCQSAEANNAYVIPGVYEFIGYLDVDLLESSFRKLIARHEVLRTVFREDASGNVRQYIFPANESAFSIAMHDLRNTDKKAERVKELVNDGCNTSFDLSRGPLLRAELYRTDDDKWIFSYMMHHIISDGWSMEVLINELLLLYTSSGKDVLPPLRIQYKDYAAWQKQQLNGDAQHALKRYWLKQLEGPLHVLDLPVARKRPVLKTYNGASFHHSINPGAANGIKQLVKENSSTLFMGLLAAVKVLFYRYTGQEDIIIGTPMAGRDHADLSGQIGFYTNTLALRTRFSGDDSFSRLLLKVKQVTLEGYENQAFLFDELVSILKIPRDASRHPLFDVQVIVHNEGSVLSTAQRKLGEITASKYPGMELRTSVFDMVFNFTETKNGLNLDIAYNPDIFSADAVLQLFTHFDRLLQEIVKDPEKEIRSIDYLTPDEKLRLLVDFNNTGIPYDPDATLVSLFRDQAEKTPDNTAVVSGTAMLTYRELDERSDALANYLLKEYHVQSNDLVGVMVDRSVNMLICILGILKAGAAYLPVDSEYPRSRKQFIVDDSNIRVLLTQTDHLFDIDYFQGNVFAVDVQLDSLGENSIPPVQVKPHDLAYVIYTSGSTGQPKGVLVGHKAIVNTICAQKSIFGVKPGQRNLQFASASFDASVSEIFVSLASGGVLYICADEVKKDPAQFGEYIRQHAIDIATIPPVYLKQLEITGIQSLKKLVTAGEAANPDAASAFLHYGDYFNAYGPTESSICATIHKTEKGGTVSGNHIPIGKPIANTSIYILDESLALVPPGVTGEICISGAGLARGYLNRPGLTAEKFVSHPFSEGSLLYRSGDLGRWLPDGTIEFAGRKDDQVKIRGYRVELGEIENALQAHDLIESAVVLATETDKGEKELVAYVVCGQAIASAELRNYLGALLPAYMLPAHFVVLDALPVNASGKIDRKALPSPQGKSTGSEYAAPTNGIEKKLAEIWEEVLKKQPIGIRDDFFLLGGDSIKSIQVVSRLRQAGYVLTVQDVLVYPVIEELARHVKLADDTVEQESVNGSFPLSPIQARFFREDNVNWNHYNQSVLLNTAGAVDEDALRNALAKIVSHHDSLRMVYHLTENGWMQEAKMDEDHFSLDVIGPVTDEEFAEHCEKLQASIDITTGPLLKAALFRGNASDKVLIVVHHLVIDGVSWRILFEDLSNLYAQYISKEPLALPSKTNSFRYWQNKLMEYAGSAVLREEESYWDSVEAVPCRPLPKDNTGGSSLMKDLASCSFTFDRQSTENLFARCYSVYRAEANETLLTAFGLALHRSFDLDKVLVNIEGHGREQIGFDIDVTRTLGWFTSVYPFVLDLAYTGDKTRQLIEIKEKLHSVPNKGIGYGVLRYLAGKNYSASPEISFNYLGKFDSIEGPEGSVLFSFSEENRGAEVSLERKRDAALEVTGILVNGALKITIGYSRSQYSEETIANLLKAYAEELEKLSELASVQAVQVVTPADLTFKKLSVDQVLELGRSFSIEDIYPLSPLQQGLYYHWLADPSSPAYFMQTSCEVAGVLDIGVLQKSYNLLVDRHAVLRTFFIQKFGDTPLQVVDKNARSLFRYIDVSDEKAPSSEYYREADRREGFDLHKGSQMRLTVLKRGDAAYELIWSHHHILMDGWCGSILLSEFFSIYYRLMEGDRVRLPKIYPYSRYIAWLDRVDKPSSLLYWKKYLNGYSNPVGLPVTVHGDREGYLERKQVFRLPDILRKAVNALCTTLGITENSFLQAVWGILMCKYNNVPDAVFGAVVSGRPAELEGVEEMIGLFSNTVPVRVSLSPGMQVAELLKQVQQGSVESIPHHYIQLAEIQSGSETGRNLFNQIIVFENFPVQEIMKQGLGKDSGNAVSFAGIEVFERSNYDLTLTVNPGENFGIRINCNGNLYSAGQVTRLKEHLILLMEQIASNPLCRLEELELLTAQEKNHLLAGLNNTSAAYPSEKTLIRLFEEQVERTPEATAIAAGNGRMSYRELDERTNRLAHYLVKTYGIGPGDLAAVKQERSEWIVISILAVLKCGAAYVPVDPEYPAVRIDYMISDSQCKVIIDEKVLTEFKSREENCSSISPGLMSAPTGLAYVIYTSGSTGKPKGVMIENRSVVNYVSWCLKQYLGKDGYAHFGLFTSLSFDLTVTSLFTSLLSGGVLTVYAPSLELDEVLLAELKKEGGNNVIKLTPSHISMIPDLDIAASGVEKAIVGGEALTSSHVNILTRLNPSIEIFNEYGPTEATVGCIVWKVQKETAVLIGKPMMNTQVYILGDSNELLPAGSTGEICIGGTCLARGYLNLPALTAERFIENPYKSGERLYRTGDLGCWTEDDNILYKGRKDDQVKIRGYRIEPADVEQALLACRGIRQAIVLAREDQDGEKHLAAFIVSEKEFNIKELKEQLLARLPDYMIPSGFIPVDTIPLTANGKVDRKKLLSIALPADEPGFEYVPPGNEFEHNLIEVVEDVLKKKPVGLNADYFALGGDSIRSIQIVSRLRKRGYVLTLQDILSSPVLGDLARKLKHITRTVSQEPVEGTLPLGPIQAAFFENTLEEKHHYNQSVVLIAKSPVSEDALRAALNKLVLHHDALRMVFAETPGGWMQENKGKEHTCPLEVFENTDQKRFLVECERIQSSFDLKNGPLFKAALFRTGTSQKILLTAHHLVVDGVSWRIIFEDLAALYSMYLEGTEPVLPLKTDSFKYWIEKLAEYARGEALLKEESYWSAVEALPVQTLPLDKPSGTNFMRDLAVCSFSLDENTTELLSTQCYAAYRTEINDILLAGLVMAVHEIFGLESMAIALEGHGREQVAGNADITRTVGWFTSVYPVVFNMGQAKDKIHRLIEVKETLHRVPNKGIGYGMLRYMAGRPYKLNPEIMFNYMGDFGSGVEIKQGDTLFGFSEEYHGKEAAGNMNRNVALSVSGIRLSGKTSFSVAYSTAQFHSATIERLASSYEKHLLELISTLSGEKTSHVTPVDLTYKGLSIQDIEKLNALSSRL